MDTKPSPNDAFRWICPKCSTVNGIEDAVCLGGSCGTLRPVAASYQLADTALSGAVHESMLRRELEVLRAAVKEWMCEACNYVYPGSPQPGFHCVICPRCEGRTAPRQTIELRKANAQVKEACEYLRRSAALIAIEGNQSMALAVARNADRIERGEPQPSIRKRQMSRADAQKAFDAMERAYWASVEIMDSFDPIGLPPLADSETGSFTSALKESQDVAERRMARGTQPKD